MMRATKTDRLTITLAGGQRRALMTIASKELTSAATVIRWALDDYIEKKLKRQRKGNKTK
ncbi:MAG: hypothetical protein ACYDCM_13140 [Candidatus Acidiferrales bacterium]